MQGRRERGVKIARQDTETRGHSDTGMGINVHMDMEVHKSASCARPERGGNRRRIWQHTSRIADDRERSPSYFRGPEWKRRTDDVLLRTALTK